MVGRGPLPPWGAGGGAGCGGGGSGEAGQAADSAVEAKGGGKLAVLHILLQDMGLQPVG